jgi:uncharacterized membrane protein YhaH (DUF805 family)
VSDVLDSAIRKTQDRAYRQDGARRASFWPVWVAWLVVGAAIGMLSWK